MYDPRGRNIHHGNGEATVESVCESTQYSLEKADELGYESIAISIIGAGAVEFECVAEIFERILKMVLVPYLPDIIVEFCEVVRVLRLSGWFVLRGVCLTRLVCKH